MEKDTGGPAFPLQSIGPDFAPGYSGMTLRDYFAIHASDDDVAAHTQGPQVPCDMPDMMSKPIKTTKASTRTREQARYAFADAMLEARK